MENRVIRKFIERNTTANVLFSGKRLFAWQYAKMESINFDQAKAHFKIRSEQYRFREYEIIISGFDSETIKTSCTCDYEWEGICKHRVAALMEIDRQLTEKKHVYTRYNPADQNITLPSLEESFIAAESSDEDWQKAQKIVDTQRVKILYALNERAEMIVEKKDELFNVTFERKTARIIHTTCTCKDETNPLCVHKVAALLELKNKFGIHAFDEMRDWTKDKNDLLAEYGYSLADNIEKKFDFKVINRKLLLMVLDKSIHKLSQYQHWEQVNQKLFFQPEPFDIPELSRSPALRRTKEIPLLIYLIDFESDPDKLPGFTIAPFKCRQSTKTGKLTYIRDLSSFQGEPDWVMDESDIEINRIAKAIGIEGIKKYIKAEDIGLKSDYWDADALRKEQFSNDDYTRIQAYIGEHLYLLFRLLSKKKVYINVNEAASPTHDDLQPLWFLPDTVKLAFTLREEGDLLLLMPFLSVEDYTLPLKKIKIRGFWLVQYGEKFYQISALHDANVISYFEEHGLIKVKADNFSGFLQDFVMPLAVKYPVEIQTNRPLIHIDGQLRPKLYVKELDKFLLLVPAFEYEYAGEINEFEANSAPQWVIQQDGTLIIVRRNVEAEEELMDFLKSLHPDFGDQGAKPYFYLHFDEVMKNEWFFKVFDRIKEKQIPVFGFNSLSNLKYNYNRPQLQMRTSSGIDWFEMQVQISFGDQMVSLANVRKAILNKQNYVQLGDGTLGVLPEDWLLKYASLFRLGTVKGDNIELSKKHFSIIDNLHDELDSLEVQQEIFEKKQKLLNFKEIAHVELPQNVKATLRDYQIEGFKWLNFLDEFKWGGCLADDMGLGKTIQVLTFLQHQKNLHPHATNLVVVPTTLIFNWNAEVEKFCPELKVYTHRGIDRKKGLNLFDAYDIILTTYGTLRSDIEILAEYSFHYIILDESQAIKNPNSQIAKAVKLLKARNRLVMTGTPIENNTFDLYSQMDFLNPGLLGGEDFFKSEYAIAIDKFRDVDKAQELRKIVYPFMLKRTKEEVAKDLPDKMEMVLYCEMEKQQRKVYDAFKQKYKQEIMRKITEEGLNKSGFLILEGLLKLRQICDSPALLSGDEDYGNESVKLSELVREIEENASNHKILVFSQFLKMLELIRERLDELNISYQYLDGQTVDRAEKVNRFQSDSTTRVFLISLKAGGVGINLTEADYVYLVDPWWNPAVEQQAIDRTHRIGQTKKIFAYRMICKDSIEEKILQLQAKKKLIAEDIISTEAGFMKKLTQEDIEELFS